MRSATPSVVPIRILQRRFISLWAAISFAAAAPSAHAELDVRRAFYRPGLCTPSLTALLPHDKYGFECL